MEPSLSVILPVHNAQSTLPGQVHDLLEVLPDLTESFDVLIVDDGSMDATEEVAHDLAVRYPQIRVIRHAHRTGGQTAVRGALQHCDGEIVFVHGENRGANPGELYRLWQMRRDEDLVMAYHEPTAELPQEGLLQRLRAWGVALKRVPMPVANYGGVQMIRRHAVHPIGSRHAGAGSRSSPADSKLQVSDFRN